MSLKDEQLDDAQVLSTGDFKLDRRRAMEKMARFQLENPHRYVLELVAAAVCAGAELIEVVNDADDFEISWDGEHLAAEELEALFDHIFSRSRERRARMLQHLAQGIHGALGLQPRWVYLERPGLRLDLSDPVEPARGPSERREGSWVHVKERFSLDVVREWVLPFDSLYETRLLREAALHCPVPIVINGKPMRKPLVGPPPLRHHRVLGRSTLWLDEDPEARVALVRDGIVVGHERLEMGELRLAGWVDADRLELNASRSKVVQDKAWKELGQELVAHAVALVEHQLDAEVAAFDGPRLRDAALALLLEHARAARALKQRPLLRDANGRAWSLAELLQRQRVITFREPGLQAPELPDPQFLLPAPPAAGPRTWQLVRARCQNRLRDEQDLLRELARGRARRAALLRARRPLKHSQVAVQRSFRVHGEWGSCEGSVAWGGAVPEGEGSRLELRVEGLPVEVQPMDVPGGLCMRVESPELKANPAFDAVLRDKAYAEVWGVARVESERLLRDLAERCPQHPEARRAVLAWVARPSAGDWGRLKRRLEPAFLHAPLFEGPSGELDLAELIRWLEEDGRLRFTERQTPLPEEPGRLVFADRETRALLRQLVGKAAHDATQELSDAAVRESRQAAEPLPAHLDDYVVAKAPIQRPGLHGEVGFTVRAEGDATRVRVLHRGVDLGVLEVDLGLPGSLAVVDWSEARPNTRWDGLAEPGPAARQLRKVLDGPLRSLLLSILEPLPEPQAVLPVWLAGALRRLRPMPDELGRAPLFLQADGRQLGLLELEQRALELGGLDCVDPALAEQVPEDLGQVLLLDASRRRVLSARLGATQLRDARPRIEARHEAAQRYLRRPEEPEHPGRFEVVAVQRLGDESLRVSVGLSVDDGHQRGLLLFVRYEGRLLTTVTEGFPVAAVATVSGSRVRPNPLHTQLHGEVQVPLVRGAAELAREALETWLQTPALPAVARLRLMTWLLAEQPEHPRLAWLEAFPLFPAMDGRLYKLAELRERELVRVPRRFQGHEAPDQRAWLLVDASVAAVLDAAGLRAEQGTQLLEAYEAGEERRLNLPLRSVHVPGDWLVSAVVRRDGAEHFLGLAERWTRQGTLEWLVQRRVLDTENPRYDAPVRVRVDDPRIQADPSFSNPRPGKALEDARVRARELVGEFMLELARALGGGGSWRRLTLLKPEQARHQLLRWAAPRSDLPRAFEGVAVLRTSDGRELDLHQLRALAGKGPLRVVPPGTLGRPADPERPVIVASEGMQRALSAWRGVQDYSQELAREEKARLRADAAPVVPERESGPQVLMELPAPGARQGWLQVHRSGRSRLTLHVDWRELSDLPHRGPVPLVGHLSDGALRADSTWTAAVEDAALEALRRDVEQLSEEALPTLLERLSDEQTHLWLVLLRRAFKHRRDMPKAARKSTPRGRLAQRQLFRTGAGMRLSAAQLVALRKPPLWVPAELEVSSGDEDRPFLCIERGLIPLAISVFGGEQAEDHAKARLRVLERRRRARQPFELPPRRQLARTQAEGKRFKLLAGLDAVLDQPGRVAFRVEGVPLCAEELPNLPGLVAVVELPEGQADEGFTRPRGDRARDQALREAYAKLVEQAGPEVAASWTARSRLVRVLPGLRGKARAAWAECPMLRGPEGLHSLKEAQSAAQVCLGDAEREGVLVLLDEPEVRSLLQASRIPVEDLDTWSMRQAVKRSKQDRARARARLAERSGGICKVLFAGLPTDSKLERRVRNLEGGQGPTFQRLLEHPESAELWVLIWRLADRELVQAQRPDLAAEVALRVAERLHAQA